MKNLKKVLALAVAFVMCFTMFAGAAVYSDVPAGSDYSEAVSLLSDLGIIAGMPDGSFGVDKTITRADAACLIARMLTGETMPSKYAGASNFVDVPKSAYYESAVAYCAIMGITSGTSATAGTYSPSREITDGEFIAMITRALGYDSAANPLQFPMGNVARAQQEGILDGVNVEVNSPALRGEDAQMIYNALFADYDAYAKQQNIYQSADDQVEYTIAHEVFSLDRLAVSDKDEVKYKDEIEDATNPAEKCYAHQWVVVGVDPRDAANTYTAFPILDKDKTLDPDWTNATDKDYAEHAITFVYEGDAESILGYEVELWGDDDHTGTEHDIVAVKTVKGQTAYDWNISMGEDGSDELTVASDKTVDAEEAIIAVENTIDKDSGDLFEDVHIDDSKDVDAYLLYNFDPASSDADDKWQKNEWKNKDGDGYRLFDWDSDGDIDFVLKTTRKYGEVTDIDSQDIAFKCILNGEEISVDREIDGDQLKFNCSGIEEGDVVEVTYSRAYSTSEKGEVVTADVKKVTSDIKQLTKVSTKGELEMTFDGDVYKYADDDYVWDYVEDEDNKLVEDDLEANYEIWLDANGYIVKLEESDDKTGYLVALELEDGYRVMTKGRSDRALMKVKLDDNTVDVFEVAYDLQITGTKGKTTEKDAEAQDIQYLTYNPFNENNYQYNAIDSKSIKSRQDLTDQFYDKKLYVWTDQNRVVGQVFKYWMDSDKVITKLERVAETVDYYEQYYDDTGVVRVSGGAVKDKDGNIDSDKRSYLGREFNGNVYLKQSKVLFITDYGFVGKSDYNNDSELIADEDKVLAIEPTTANLRALSIDSRPYYNLADSYNGQVINKNSGEANEAPNNTGTSTNRGALYNGFNVVGKASYDIYGSGKIEKSAVGEKKSAQIAYDIDDNNYATAAIMTINNFSNFDKQLTVGLITDVSAQNRKNTVFTIDGAVAGKVGSFTTVEADDGAEEIFHHWEYSADDGWHAEPYKDLSEVRDDINDKGVYAEITQDADGKITKVVVMDYEKDFYSGLVGEKRAVYRLVIGNKSEVDGSTVAFASHANNVSTESGKNIMAFDDTKENLYEMGNISWHNWFNLTGSTAYYTITNKLKDIIGRTGGYLQAQYDMDVDGGHSGDDRLPSNGFNKEPKLKESDAASITTSRTRETSNADKYAVADVVFKKDDVRAITANGAGGGGSRYFDILRGKDAIAVFSYEKRFGQSNDLDPSYPTVEVVEQTDTKPGSTTGTVQETVITLGGNGIANDVAERELTVKVGDTEATISINGSEDSKVVAGRLADELNAKIGSDFSVVRDDSGANPTITLTAKKAADHRAVTLPDYPNAEEDATAGTKILDDLYVHITNTNKGVAPNNKSVPAVLKLKFTGASNIKEGKTDVQFSLKLRAAYYDKANKNWDWDTEDRTPDFTVSIDLYDSAESVANKFKAQFDKWNDEEDWDVDTDGDTVILTQTNDSTKKLQVAWGDPVVTDPSNITIK